MIATTPTTADSGVHLRSAGALCALALDQIDKALAVDPELRDNRALFDAQGLLLRAKTRLTDDTN